MNEFDRVSLSGIELDLLKNATGAPRYVLELVFKDINDKRKATAEALVRREADELAYAQKVLAKSRSSCCCAGAAIVQPCGPCRCDDHADCVGLVAS